MSKMSEDFDSGWDLDKHFSPHEPSSHWTLRRTFMERNKERFPEQRLVCLAQTLANVRFLGCRYPRAVMDLVEEMAAGIQEDEDLQQQQMDRGTLVSGSEAAEARVNRRGTKRKYTGDASSSSAFPTKQHLLASSSSSTSAPECPSAVAVPDFLDESSDPLSSFIIVRLFADPSRKDGEIDEHPCNVLKRSAGLCKMSCTWRYAKDHPFCCTVKVEDEDVSSAAASTKEEAREEAARRALKRLSTRCYTLRVKGEREVDPPTAIGEDNVGHRLLTLMGWTGGGLGKDGEGISEPITAASLGELRPSRGRRRKEGGLGVTRKGGETTRRLKTAAVLAKDLACLQVDAAMMLLLRDNEDDEDDDDRDQMEAVKRMMEDYAASSNPYDLVFGSGFDKEQRKQMHTLAEELGLKSKSSGKADNRSITISRRNCGRMLLQELLLRDPDPATFTLSPPKKERVQ